MPEATNSDHDQRLKVLLKGFFEQFFLCFFPVWASRFDFSVVSWLDKEIFLAPPQEDLGYHARSALGLATLPTSAAVEVEAIFDALGGS